MQLIDDRLFLSASDLVAFMECEHLAALDLRTLRGMETIAVSRDDTALLVARKGDEHERAYLERILAESRDVVVVPTVADGLGDLHEAVDRTTKAMRAGTEVIYQGALLDGDWRGYADFLERVRRRRPLRRLQLRGSGHKAGTAARPRYLVQLCLYASCWRRAGPVAGRMHVVSGSGSGRIPGG